ncbi:MAG: ATP-binding protein [Thiomicrorhabdus sp.]|nr:ATP-binding protein [Thiomicrorhabdus sp.]
MFKDTFIDFTYPKKITDSTIEGEFLKDFPKIKYKKVCILMGANASGKTTLGKVMCAINNYLSGTPLDHVKKSIHNKTKKSYIKVTYITPDTGQIHALKIVFNQDGLISESYKINELRASKSLKKTLSDLKNSKPEFLFERDENNHGIKNPGFASVAKLTGITTLDTEKTGWHYLYSDFQASSLHFEHNNIQLLETVLKVFDASINKIEPIINSEFAYVIEFKNDDIVIVDNGTISNDDRLSRGTIESIEVAGFISAIIQLQAQDKSSTYFLDEKMAYSHSEIEIAMLNLMIGKLNNQSQLFYTTHNYDILEMNLPSHSYIFMKKEDFVTVSHPEKMGYTKNDRSLLGYVKNDVFNTLPDTSKIDELL